MRDRILPALDSLLHGLISLGLGALLAAFILVGASQHGGQGNSQLAADSLRMLWSPAIFAGVGVLLIANGLLRGLWLLLPLSRVRDVGTPAGSLFPDRCGMVEVGLVGGKLFRDRAVGQSALAGLAAQAGI